MDADLYQVTYIVTFFSHFGAVRYKQLCAEAGVACRMMPVPRDLSSSCGICVRCEGGYLPPGGACAEEIEQIARGRQGKGITEVHIVGGVHPEHGLEYYIDMIRRVKAILPEAAVKAFTAIELSYMIRKAGLTVEEGLRRLKEAGMDAIPGGGAEIFDREIRSRI